MFSLKDRIALVTGSTKGIGLEIIIIWINRRYSRSITRIQRKKTTSCKSNKSNQWRSLLCEKYGHKSGSR